MSGVTLRVQQLEYQLAGYRGAAIAESRTAQEQLVSLRAALPSQRLGLQFQGAVAAARRVQLSRDLAPAVPAGRLSWRSGGRAATAQEQLVSL